MSRIPANKVLVLLLVVSGQSFGAETNILKNGDFEAGAAEWSLNPAMSPAELVVVSGQPGREVHGGRKALLVRNHGGSSHVCQGEGKAGVDYELTFWARGGAPATASDGSKLTPKVSVAVYVYGKPEENGGRNVFLTPLAKYGATPLGADWQKFQLPVKVVDAEVPGAKIFSLAFGVQGEVVLDDVVLTEVELWRRNLIFHLPFDEGLMPAVVRGKAVGEVHGNVRLVEGKKGKAGSFTDNAHLVFDAVDNFDQAEGTIAMWINPYWSQLDGMPHCFFEAPVLPAMALDGGFVITKGFSANVNPNATYFYNSPGDHGICCDLGLVPNEWTHLAFSWSVSKQTMKAYRNGELVVIAQHPITPRPKSAGRPLVIGARAGGRSPESVKKMRRDFGAAGGCSAEAAIDELMIFNAPLSDADVARLADGDSKTAPAEERASRQLAHERAEDGARNAAYRLQSAVAMGAGSLALCRCQRQ